MKIASPSSGKTDLTEAPHFQERYLIITADDFGASININEGIKIAADKKAITSIAVLTNFIDSLPYLKEIAENHPEISIGVHLNIVTGKPVLPAEEIPSLVRADGSFYTIDALLPKIQSVSADDLRKELRAQILTLANYGIRPEHLSDQFGILSYYSPFFDIVIELAKEFNVPVRTPVIASVKYPDLFPNSQIHKRGRQIALRLALTAPFKAISLLKYSRINEMEKKAQKLDEHGILHPDLFIESFWGDPTRFNFLHILERLPDGTSEVVLHLGTNTRQENYPSGLDLDYFKNRENELITITSNYLKEYFNYLNIRMIRFSEMSKF
jgi:predicted glycoside hydrolase/deacetylase ChbG (UPF0249 family)